MATLRDIRDHAKMTFESIGDTGETGSAAARLTFYAAADRRQ